LLGHDTATQRATVLFYPGNDKVDNEKACYQG
jgi:hypothetical protein